MSNPAEPVYLDLDDLIAAHRAIHGSAPEIRDAGLVASALARPQMSLGGEDAYPDLPSKAAALMQSIARNHALIDGNKRLAWIATALFLEFNGVSLQPPSQDAIVDFVLQVATGELPDVDDIAKVLDEWSVAPGQ